MFIKTHVTFEMKKQRKINKQRENKEIYCFCEYLLNEVKFRNHFSFISIFPDVLSENEKNTHSNFIYRCVSIVISTFSIVFYCLSADISFVFRIFAITSTKIVQISSNFDSVYGLMVSI